MLPPKVKIEKSPDFTFAVAKIRSWESKLLAASTFYQLADSRGFAQLESILSSTVYVKKIALRDFDDSFDAEEFSTLKEIKSFIKNSGFMMPFFYKRDFHNLKLFAKSKFSDIETDWLKEDFTGKELAIKAITEQDLSLLPKTYRDFVSGAWMTYEKTGDWQILDAFLDKKLYEQILNITKPFLFANSFFKTEIDLINIKTFIRCKNNNAEVELFGNLFIGGGFLDKIFFIETFKEPTDKFSQRLRSTPYDILTDMRIDDSKDFGEFREIEKGCCLVLLKYLSRAKYTAFGYEPVLRYIFLKNNEMRNIRAILVGKTHDISPEEIKARIGPFHA